MCFVFQDSPVILVAEVWAERFEVGEVELRGKVGDICRFTGSFEVEVERRI
jgi:hypothetical protein